jgi:Protein of unknown function (DUF551)
MPEMNWISVNDTLPPILENTDTSIYVIVCINHPRIGKRAGSGRYTKTQDGTGFQWMWEFEIATKYVTHWMYYPEPPCY